MFRKTLLSLVLLTMLATSVAAGSDLGNTVTDTLGDLAGEPNGDAMLSQAEQRANAARGTAQQQLGEAMLLLDETVQPVTASVDEIRRIALDALNGEQSSQAAPEETSAAPQSQQTAKVTSYTAPILLMAAAAGLGALGWFIGQTAAVGAGAASADGRRFLPHASPLFTRFEKDTVLGHPKREALYGAIVGKPGTTLQDLCEESGLSRTAVTHHLRLMEQQHLIVSKRVGRSRHFFENGGRYGRDQKEAYAVLHNDRSKEINEFISTTPGTIQKDLCSQFEIQPSVAHWHVKRLLEAGLIEAFRQGRTVKYFPSATPAYA